MSDLLVLGLKLLFLALLWLFVLFAVNVIRTDLFGRRVPAASLAESTPGRAAEPAAPRAVAGLPAPVPPRSKRGRRGSRLPSSLTVTEGAIAGTSLALGGGILIGRTPEATLDLADQFMSNRHALISPSPSGYVVEDLGSTNGTFHNGVRLSGPAAVGVGDTLRIGRTTLTVG